MKRVSTSWKSPSTKKLKRQRSGRWQPPSRLPIRFTATLIGISEFMRHGADIDTVKMTAVGLEVMIGGLTFTGSLMAAAKLQELLRGAPITYRGQNVSNITLLGVMLASWITLIVSPSITPLFFVMVALALLFGFLLVIPIGAADMPVVIALLNSYAGLADAAMGFVLMNKI